MIVSLLFACIALAEEPTSTEEVESANLQEQVSELRAQVSELENTVQMLMVSRMNFLREEERQRATLEAQNAHGVEIQSGVRNECGDGSYDLEMTSKQLGPADGHRLWPDAHVYVVDERDGRHDYVCLMVEECKAAPMDQGGDEVCVDYSQCCDSGLYIPTPSPTGVRL